MSDKIQDSVVVITGASSGIGRAAAREFARRGAIVVVAARRERLLHEVMRECKELSGCSAGYLGSVSLDMVQKPHVSRGGLCA